jgi:hypothetical protein
MDFLGDAVALLGSMLMVKGGSTCIQSSFPCLLPLSETVLQPHGTFLTTGRNHVKPLASRLPRHPLSSQKLGRSASSLLNPSILQSTSSLSILQSFNPLLPSILKASKL